MNARKPALAGIALLAARMPENGGSGSLDHALRVMLRDDFPGLKKQHNSDSRRAHSGFPDCQADGVSRAWSFSHSAYEMRTALGSPLRVTTVGSPRKWAASTRCPSWSRSSLVPRCVTSMSRVYLRSMRYTMYMMHTAGGGTEGEGSFLFDLPPDPGATKRCNKCGEIKPISMFRTRKGMRRRPDCKDCYRASYNEWRQRLGPDQRRAEWLWQLYRLRWTDYQKILAAQDGLCAICVQPFSDNSRLIHVDHDHACDHPDKGGKSCPACVRGILCQRCNVFVGWIETGSDRIGAILRHLGDNGTGILLQIIRDAGYDLVTAVASEALASGDHDG